MSMSRPQTITLLECSVLHSLRGVQIRSSAHAMRNPANSDSLKWLKATLGLRLKEPSLMQDVGADYFRGYLQRVECIHLLLRWTSRRICWDNVLNFLNKRTFRRRI